MVYRTIGSRITVLVFANGKIVITGAKELGKLYDTFAHIYQLLLDHKLKG